MSIDTEAQPVTPEISKDKLRDFQNTVKKLVGKNKEPEVFHEKEFSITVDGKPKKARLLYGDNENYIEGPSASIQIIDTEAVNDTLPYWEIAVNQISNGSLHLYFNEGEMVKTADGLYLPPRSSYVQAIDEADSGMSKKQPVDKFHKVEDILERVKKQQNIASRLMHLPKQLFRNRQHPPLT